MAEENLPQKFQVHYYFDDDSHSMNALDFPEFHRRLLVSVL